MQNRSIATIIILSIVTFGIYSLVWFVKTKGELNQQGAEIPTAWLLIVPIVNIFWMWKYFEAAEKVTNGKLSAILLFLLGFFITPIISMALAQDAYNKMGSTGSMGGENDVNPAPVDVQPPQQPTASV